MLSLPPLASLQARHRMGNQRHSAKLGNYLKMAVPDASPELNLDCCLRPQLPGSARLVPHGFAYM